MDAQKLIDNFSTHLKNVIARAISLAAYLNYVEVEPFHLLIALCEEQGSIGAEILKKSAVTTDQIYSNVLKQKELRQKPVPLDRDTNHNKINLPELSLNSRKVLEKALTRAHSQGHTYIGTEHLLHGLMKSIDHQLLDLLSKLKIDKQAIQEQIDFSLYNTSKFSDIDNTTDILEELEGQMPGLGMLPLPPHSNPFPVMTKQNSKNPSAVAMFTTDLTSKYAQKNIDPVIGRENEIERIINILSRRNKNNPILAGEPGVGKTAIVEGLAKKIAEGDVPDVLKRKKILALDLTLLVAGTIYRGEFEARLKQIVDECAANQNYILFIDELHNIIGTGSNQGTMDAANILKPALARGQLRCIGATTLDEYKKYISTDPALERRFQEVYVEEPSNKDTLEILKGIKKYYEQFHNVSITNKALESAIEYSNRYIHDNFQPDKSIDLIDEACGAVKTKRKLSPIQNKYYKLLDDLEICEREKELAISEERLKDALNYKNRAKILQNKAALLKKQIEKDKSNTKTQVTHKDIANIVSKKMHIDRNVIMQSEWENLSTLENRIKKYIVGQDNTINKVVESLRRSYLRDDNTHKPLASFLFVGPSGVGKTELAKILARELYSDEKSLIKIDMSEFAESHSISKLLGSPAGYIGYRDRNPILDKIKKKPYSVILFDEIDKAHNDVTKLLLQILDEGELSDSNGKKIHFKQSIIIMTSNLGAHLFKSSGIGFGNDQKKQRQNVEFEKNIINKLKEELGTALISRVGTTCIFNVLTEKDIQQIITTSIEKITNHLNKKYKLSVYGDEEAVRQIAKETASIDFGARNVEKKVEELIHELVVNVIKEKTKTSRYILTREKNHYTLK